MTPKFDRDEILAADEQTVIHDLVPLIIEFAVLGYLDVARTLISMLNGYKPANNRSVVLRPLWLAWEVTGQWPDGERARVDEPLDRMAGSYSKSLWLLHGEKIDVSKDLDGVRSVLDKVNEINPEHADATTGSAAMDKSAGLVKALETALELSHVQQKTAAQHDASPDQILKLIADRLHCNSQITYLTHSTTVWETLKDGALARAVGVDDSKVQELAKEVEKTFAQRFAQGRQFPAERSMLQLLQTCSDNTTRSDGPSAGFYGEIGSDIPPTLFEPPATAAQIAELEKRLDTTLPDDYKEFLQHSNGFGRSWGGVIHEAPLHAIDMVRWISDDEDYFLDLTLDLLGIDTVHVGFVDDQDEWPTVGRALEIGTEDIDNIWLLPPETVDRVRKAYLESLDSSAKSDDDKLTIRRAIDSFAGSMEKFMRLDWGALTWASGGAVSMHAFTSFKNYIHQTAINSGTDVFGADNDEDRYERYVFAYSCR